MLNSIATALIAYLLRVYSNELRDNTSQIIKTKPMASSAFIPPLNSFLSKLGFHLPNGTELNGFLVIAILLGVGFYVLVWRTRFGYDLRASGANPAAARASGVNPKRMILITILISGALAGLAGMGPLLGDPQFHRYTEQFPTELGFTGIAVALVGRNHPAGIAASALLFAFLDRSTQVLTLQNIPSEITTIMQGSMILSAVVAYSVAERLAEAAQIRAAARAAARGPTLAAGAAA
jgi:simple sugar transport system permease protein